MGKGQGRSRSMMQKLGTLLTMGLMGAHRGDKASGNSTGRSGANFGDPQYIPRRKRFKGYQRENRRTNHMKYKRA